MKRIIIDLGNTQGKIAVYDGAKMLGDVVCCKHSELAALAQQVCEREDITLGAMSSVVANDGVAEELAKHGIEVQRISAQMPLPFAIDNKMAAQQLGADRVAAVAAAQILYGQKAKLLIDIGTMITYEFLNADNVYFGGTISPGIEARFSSMCQCTSLLPLGKITDFDTWIGIDTPTALAAGVVNGIVFEMQGYIDKAKAEVDGLETIVLTGGAASFFARRLKSKVVLAPELVLIGTAFLTTTNDEKSCWNTID